MGRRNYLIEGVSGTGKTTVAEELTRRGYEAIHGDRVLAYQGDPMTGEPTDGFRHENHIWNVETVRSLAADHSHEVTFFCGGSRNFAQFLDVIDAVFVLDVDPDTIVARLARRPPDEWGSSAAEQEFVRRLHSTKEDLPGAGTIIDTSRPVETVVDEILTHVAPVD